MGPPATVASVTVTPAIRDRLRLHGLAGEAYASILGRLLDAADRDAFLAKARQACRPPQAPDWTDLDAL